MKFSHPFFDKIKELRDKTPYLASNFRVFKGSENVNCPYCDEMGVSSDCHMCFTCAELFQSVFCEYLLRGNECADCSNSTDMNLCYECSGNSEKCHECTYCVNCSGCFRTHFCHTCFNCIDCFGCVELENKKFCIFNKQYTEAEYRKHLADLHKLSPNEIDVYLDKLREKIPMVDLIEYENVDSKLMVYSFLNTRCYDLLWSKENEDCAYLFEGLRCKNTVDGVLTMQTQTCYEFVAGDSVSESAFMIDCSRTHFSYFCNYCADCEYCFGCVGLEFKKYHIFNKPYFPDEYHFHVDKILKELSEKNVNIADDWYRAWALDVITPKKASTAKPAKKTSKPTGKTRAT